MKVWSYLLFLRSAQNPLTHSNETVLVPRGPYVWKLTVLKKKKNGQTAVIWGLGEEIGERRVQVRAAPQKENSPSLLPPVISPHLLSQWHNLKGTWHQTHRAGLQVPMLPGSLASRWFDPCHLENQFQLLPNQFLQKMEQLLELQFGVRGLLLITMT